MKRILISVALIISAWTVDAQFYFGYAFDVKMALNGPSAESYEDIDSSHNFEFRVGLELEDYPIRIGFTAENHNTISYFKWAFHGDYILADFPFEGFNNYAGIEAGFIHRHHIPYPGGSEFTYSPESLTAGVNFEMQYEFLSWLALAVNYNIFWAENALQNDAVVFWDRVRTDLMLAIIFKVQ